MQTSLLTRLVALVDYNPNDHEHRFAEGTLFQATALNIP